jgi:U4/U6.U5 tri-snRNP-associated protein 2
VPEVMEEVPFMYLTCDLPPPPLYPDEMQENIIPQVPLFTVLSKFNGTNTKEYKTYKENFIKRFEITSLPEYIILYMKVFIIINNNRIAVKVCLYRLRAT